MKDLTSLFLTDEEKRKIETAVQKAEKITSGEIVPMIVSSSYHYPLSNVIGGFVLSLVPSVIVSFFWGNQSMWMFLGLLMPLFLVMHETVKRVYPLKRLFISEREMTEEVEEAALKNFYLSGLYRTREETGVLVFISLFERRVRVLADRGINSVVDHKTWDEIVALIIDGIKKKKQAEAIVRAVERLGQILADKFPVRHDDTDELKNLIIKD